MRAKPSDATIIHLLHRAHGLWAFSVKDVERILGVSNTTAKRYIARMKDRNKIQFKYKDLYNYYEVKREDR